MSCSEFRLERILGSIFFEPDIVKKKMFKDPFLLYKNFPYNRLHFSQKGKTIFVKYFISRNVRKKNLQHLLSLI